MASAEWHPTLAELVFAILLVIFPWGFQKEVPVIWRLFLWALAWAICLHLAFTQISWLIGRSLAIKILLSLGASCFLVAGLWNWSISTWLEERANETTGILHSLQQGWKKGRPPNTTNDIEIGQSNVMIAVDLPPDQQQQDFARIHHFANLRIEKGDTELQFSTTVRDRDGAVVAIIEQNRWTVYSPFCLDKNYTGDSLEVKDKRNHIVLQIRVLPDRIQLQGEWNDEYGRGTRMIQSPYKNRPGGLFIRWDSPQQAELQDRQETEIKPWFRYPSKDHWGERVND